MALGDLRREVETMEVRERMRLALIALAELMDQDGIEEQEAIEKIAGEHGVNQKALALEYAAA